MRLFGPYTVTFDSTDLGKTSGGVTLEVYEQERYNETIGETLRVAWVTRVSGEILLFDAEVMSVVDDLVKSTTPGTLVFTGIDHKITITNATLSYPRNFTIGTNRHVPFNLRFHALYDSAIHDDTNPILKLEGI